VCESNGSQTLPPDGAADRDAAILALLPLARVIARDIGRKVTMQVDDLIAAGYEGAVRAVDRFDPNRGVPIERYAAAVIRGKILNAIRRWDPISERDRQRMRDIDKGLSPEDEVLAHRVKCGVPLSLDGPLPERSRLRSGFSRDPLDVVIEKELKARVLRLRSWLPAREQLVITRVYDQQCSLQVVARELHITPQRASQLHTTALARMRALAS
jgi:RNA polymerase sigma factor FliA